MPVPLSRLQPSRKEEIEDWPWLDQAVLRASRSRQVCMTCHFFRNQPGARVHPAAHLPSASRSDRPWRAPHPPIAAAAGQKTCTASGTGRLRWRERCATQPAAAVAKGGLLSDGRQVRHVQPTLWDRCGDRLAEVPCCEACH